jgi:hypothetical protein
MNRIYQGKVTAVGYRSLLIGYSPEALPQALMPC